MSRELREAIADWLMLVGAVVLLASLFFTWSHQLAPAFRGEWQSIPALRGVPRDPTAWQVYSTADVLLALLAAVLVWVAFAGTRRARLVALVPAGIALAFVVHALGVPPTNGVELAGGIAGRPTAGVGEDIALAALGAAMAGLGLSFTAD